MKNTILLVGGQKGGVGKTTVAVSLAIARKRQGRDVILIDADEQKNATKWAKRRADLGDQVQTRVPCVGAFGRQMCDEVGHLAEKYEDVIIDVAGHKSEEFLSAMRVAHRFICPIRSSQFDLDTMSEVEKMVNMMLAVNPNMDSRWFLNMASTNEASRVRSAIETRESMENMTHLRPMDSYLCDRTAFEVVSRGLVVDETPASRSRDKGIAELKRLNDEAWTW